MDRTARALMAWLAAAGVAMLAASCTPAGLSKAKSSTLYHKVKDHPLIIGFEGLQPESGHRADNLTKYVARDLDLAQAASSGDESAFMPFIVEAHANGQPIYIVGYSLGGNSARNLAQACKKAGVPINILFLLDPGVMGAFTGHIPDNVGKAVFYASSTCDGTLEGKAPADYLDDPAKTLVQFEDRPDLNHLTLPENVTRSVRAEVAADLGRSAGR